MATSPLIKQLLEAGVHFGHQTKRWNPKMARFIFGARSGIYIINLEQTAQHLTEACGFVEELAAHGESILFVGTKKQAQEIVREEAARCEMFYVVNRWLGGTLTNFETIRRSAARLRELERLRESGELAERSKKEQSQLRHELERLRENLEGIDTMERLPGALFVIDTKREAIAVHEARRLDIPVVAVCDTNCDPDLIASPIPGNDDAIRSIRLITGLIAAACQRGRQRYLTGMAQAAAKAEAVAEEDARRIAEEAERLSEVVETEPIVKKAPPKRVRVRKSPPPDAV